MNNRDLQRVAAKKAYKAFKKEFVQAKGLQSKLTPRQRRRAEEDGEQMLGRCPTFKEWWVAVKQPKNFKTSPEEVQQFIEENLEWDDE